MSFLVALIFFSFDATYTEQIIASLKGEEESIIDEESVNFLSII